MNTIYVEGLKHSIRYMIPNPGEYTMIQFLNCAIRAKRDDLRLKKVEIRGHKDIFQPYDQPRQGGFYQWNHN